jgi:hypothetical protein
MPRIHKRFRQNYLTVRHLRSSRALMDRFFSICERQRTLALDLWRCALFRQGNASYTQKVSPKLSDRETSAELTRVNGSVFRYLRTAATYIGFGSDERTTDRQLPALNGSCRVLAFILCYPHCTILPSHLVCQPIART